MAIMGNQKKVLLVEDDQLIVSAVLAKLKHSKMTVHFFSAANGKEGLEVAIKEHPDLILLDIIMPVMNGIEMLRKLREDEWGKNARVVLTTNLNEDANRNEAKELGVEDYIIKSNWKLEDVFKKIKEKLGI